MADATDFMEILRALPGSYQGPLRAYDGPHAVIGLGEGALAAGLAEGLIGRQLTGEGTQFVLASGEAGEAAKDYADLAEARGAQVVRAGEGNLTGLAFLVPRGVTGTYHYAQFVAHASGHTEQATAADALLANLAARCAPEVTEGNPARDLAWTLWTRVPLLLAPEGEGWLTWAWQLLLARVGKSLALPVERDLLYVLSGAFEARHESGDGRLALILGEEDAELSLAREILQTRVDEVQLVPYPGGESGYAGSLALWYLGLWTAAYLAERYGVSPGDTAVMREALRGMGEE